MEGVVWDPERFRNLVGALERSRSVLGAFSERSRGVFEAFSGRFRNLGTFSEPFRSLGAFSEHFRSVFGACAELWISSVFRNMSTLH